MQIVTGWTLGNDDFNVGGRWRLFDDVCFWRKGMGFKWVEKRIQISSIFVVINVRVMCRHFVAIARLINLGEAS